MKALQIALQVLNLTATLSPALTPVIGPEAVLIGALAEVPAKLVPAINEMLAHERARTNQTDVEILTQAGVTENQTHVLALLDMSPSA